MTPKTRAWLLIAGVAVICAASIGGVAWYRARPISPAELLKRVPVIDTTLVYVDFEALRRSNILQLLEGSKASEDPDYQAFVSKINFDYRQDLDVALVAFAPSGKYMLVKGRFDWKSLRTYAISGGGACITAVCQMAGSTPDRRISFYPVQSNLMALAVSPDATAVRHMGVHPTAADAAIPNAPVWLSIPGSLLKSGESLPTGTRMFAHGMEKAENVILSFEPEGTRLAAKVEVRCRNEEDAVEVASQLAGATQTLKQMLAREHQTPGPADLAGVLAAGTFRSQGNRVYGYWPMERVFVETILGGGVG